MDAPSIEDLFADIGGQKNGCTHAEYHAFARRVRDAAPCRLLVFGVGRDSPAWIGTNAGGTTVFLENNPEWIARVSQEIDPALIRTVTYRQSFEDWAAAGPSAATAVLPEGLGDLLETRWDAAFVDAPWGPTFGRHQSTLAATRAVRPGGLIALHDCEREREQTVCRHLLEARGFALEEEVERLRIYRAARD